MTTYNLARGGFAAEFGKSCTKCCAVDEMGLPHFLQPDLRSDGGYSFRDKISWKQLMKQLDVRYGKHYAALVDYVLYRLFGAETESVTSQQKSAFHYKQFLDGILLKEQVRQRFISKSRDATLASARSKQ